MSPVSIFLTLRNKKQLTHDVFELEYSSDDVIQIAPGQFLLCDTAGEAILRRSYSVSWAQGRSIFFIIKRLSDGKGGSAAICNQDIGYEMQVWGPMGRFILQDNDVPKVFIGTGTGFAPLYFMLRTLHEEKKAKSTEQRGGSFFLFGVRELRDVFYQEELQKWSENYSFDYDIYCSRETSLLPEKHHRGRVTDFFKLQTSNFKLQTSEAEYYICGSPAMVTEVRSMLGLYGISEEKVFFEQY